MLRKALRKVKRIIQVGFISCVLALGLATPAHAMPVIDVAHIAQSIANTAQQIQQWSQYISQFRGYYATFNAVYYGIKNWKDMGWVDLLNLSELPCFDGVDGIDDIRNACSLTEMSVNDLQSIYTDIKWFDRMTKDPAYAKNDAFHERVRIMSLCSQRDMRRKMVITRVEKNVQRENKALLTQSQVIEAQIESLAGEDPVPTGAIAALQAKLAIIQTKMENNKQTLAAQVKVIEQQREAEMKQYQSEFQCNIDDLRNSNKALENFWGDFLSVTPGGAY